MNIFRRRTCCAASGFAIGAFLLAASLLMAQVPEAPKEAERAADEAPKETNYQVLTRGPVHEAFAKNIDTDPVEGIIIPKAPPELIEEAPPEEALEGDNVVWIPGYWGWDPEQNDFIWISGLWRDVPPGQRWVPGYWTPVDGGHQWISGFWTSAETTELTYLDYPPESLEEGPNVEAPSGDHFWVPGLWVWVDTEYQWRPGYWTHAYADWVWMPAHYVWTPYGCIFVDGYWDYQLTHRGLLFAPVYFQTPIYTQPAFVYTPSVVVDAPGLLVHLFVAPHYHHYYFGDYYAYRGDFVIAPWYTFEARAAYYDPLLVYYQWSYGRRGIDFTARLRSWNTYFVEHPDFRPRHTWRDQRDFLRRHRDDPDFRAETVAFAHSLRERTAEARDDRQFRRLDEQQRQQWRETARTFREMQSRRGETERRSRTEDTAQRGEGGRRGRLELPEFAGRVREIERRRGFRPGRDEGEQGRSPEPGRDTAAEDTPSPETPPADRPRDAEEPGRGEPRDRGERARPQEGDQLEPERSPFRRPPGIPRDVLEENRDLKGRPIVPDSVRKIAPDREREPRQPAEGKRERGDRKRGPEITPQPRSDRPGNVPGRTAPDVRDRTPDATPDPNRARLPGITPGATPDPQARGGDRGRAERTLRYPRFQFQQQPQGGAGTPDSPPRVQRPDQPDPGRSGRPGMRRFDPVDQLPPGFQQDGRRGQGGSPGRAPRLGAQGGEGRPIGPRRAEGAARPEPTPQPKRSDKRE